MVKTRVNDGFFTLKKNIVHHAVIYVGLLMLFAKQSYSSVIISQTILINENAGIKAVQVDKAGF